MPRPVLTSDRSLGACAAMWADAPVPAWGTAARAGFYVALEQNGPWGRKALTQSHLDPEIGGALESACSTNGGKALLIRSPASHPDVPCVDDCAPRRVYVSGGMTQGRPWLLTGTVPGTADGPRILLDLPFAALAAGDRDAVTAAAPWLAPHEGTVVLVCTNGKRDVCCAVQGRPVASAGAALRPGRVWETTHIGGHRFAATAVTLPQGAALARLTPELVAETVDEPVTSLPRAVLTSRHLRGLAHLAPVVQAADAYVRCEQGITDVTALRARAVEDGPGAAAGTASQEAVENAPLPGTPKDDTVLVEVGGADGGSPHRFAVTTRVLDETRRNSCSVAPSPTQGRFVTPLTV